MAPTLSVGWHTVTRLGCAASPVISPDGEWLKVTDGNSAENLLEPKKSGAMIRLIEASGCPATGACPTKYDVPLRTGPALGATPVLDGAEHLQFEVQLLDMYNNEPPDIVSAVGDQTTWEVWLPDDLQWSSVFTLTDDYILGTATRGTPSDQDLFGWVFPATAESELVVLSRDDGAIVFRAPITDDSSATVTVGPDGSLYVTLLALVHSLAIDTRPVAGLMRFTPR